MSSFPALATRNGKLYFLGHAVSQSGTWMNAAAMAWLVLDLTGSGAAVGVCASLQALPVLFVGPFAGVLVDRVSRYRLLLLLQSLQGLNALLLGILAVTGHVEVWHIFASSLAYGLGRSFEIPTRQAFMAEIVGRDQLRNGITLQSTLNNAARIVGPSLAGLVIAGVGTWLCFVLNAASYVVILGLFFALNLTGVQFRPPTARTKGRMLEGLRHVSGDPVAAPVLTMSVLSGVFLQQYQTTLPLLAKQTFDSGPQGFGVLMSGFGVGAVIGGLIAARTGRTGVRPVAIACIAVSLGYALTATMPSLALAAVVMVMVGMANISLLTTANASIQLSGGPALQGRLVALYAAANVGAAALGAPLVGLVCDAVGVRWCLVITASAGVLAGLRGLYIARGGRTSPGRKPEDESPDEEPRFRIAEER
ncbi:putative major facilitator superfamily transporter [metagenome]|uniref:Putative major facilitator superfamily transporter n=1 Tax=metagenome TaxID=256318 RepID=A0A2P2C8X7_9ZZZZ